MESIADCDVKSLINVLNHGSELIRELEAQLDLPSSAEACKVLAREAQSTFAKAIAMVKVLQETPKANSSDSVPSDSDSPRCLSSDKAFKEQERREMCRKRKNLPRWCSQVSACLGSSMEGPLDDGHSWRKYGQKDILAAKFPRGYYRCTYRHSHGCLATKQVQRSDDNPSVFDVTYRGVHTCNHGLQSSTASQPEEQNLQHTQALLPKTQQQQLLDVFRSGLTVKTEGFSSDDQLQGCSTSFSFPSTPASCIEPGNRVFSSTPMRESRFTGNYSHTFVSTTTSAESNYLSVGRMSSYAVRSNHPGLDSEIAEIISAAASTTSSPMVGMDFGLENIGFDAEFPFDFS